MYKDFDSIDSLFETIKADKEANGSNSSTLNRYPIRFVLFDSFRDQYVFTLRMVTEMGVMSTSIQSWIDDDYPDILITHQKLASEIDKHIKGLNGIDTVITPFSEVARFYDNIENKEFDALIRTIKGIESTDKAWDMHQRVYIPIVGLEAKMSTFKEDQQIFIWYTHSDESEAVQRLILTDNTSYGVTGYEDSYYRIKDVKSWVDLWKNQDAIGKQNILCE
ncbi:MAG: BREX-4 system phosphatase PglZ, partial [Bacteroidales bacterium]|nr:BREX-4 system phosphatase PglZ [Bacteroidales bacterium]